MNKNKWLIVILTGLFFITVWCIYNPTIKTDKEKNDKIIFLEKKNDSLNIIINQRDIIIKKRDSSLIEINKRQALTDVLISNNNNNLKNDKIKVKKLNTDTRYKYVDSILRCAGLRK